MKFLFLSTLFFSQTVKSGPITCLTSLKDSMTSSTLLLMSILADPLSPNLNAIKTLLEKSSLVFSNCFFMNIDWDIYASCPLLFDGALEKLREARAAYLIHQDSLVLGSVLEVGSLFVPSFLHCLRMKQLILVPRKEELTFDAFRNGDL